MFDYQLKMFSALHLVEAAFLDFSLPLFQITSSFLRASSFSEFVLTRCYTYSAHLFVYTIEKIEKWLAYSIKKTASVPVSTYKDRV
jgi:hypothetical protein